MQKAMQSIIHVFLSKLNCIIFKNYYGQQCHLSSLVSVTEEYGFFCLFFFYKIQCCYKTRNYNEILHSCTLCTMYILYVYFARAQNTWTWKQRDVILGRLLYWLICCYLLHCFIFSYCWVHRNVHVYITVLLPIMPCCNTLHDRPPSWVCECAWKVLEKDYFFKKKL